MPDAPSEPAPDAPYRPSFLRVLRQSVVALYDHLGLVVTTNLIWVVAGGIAVAASSGAISAVGRPGVVVGIPIALVGWAAANAGMWYVVHRMANRQDVALADVLAGVRGHFTTSLGLVAVHMFGVMLLAANVLFYAYQSKKHTWAGPISVFWLCVLGYFLTVMLYAYPFVMTQRVGTWAAVKKSALVAADNPGFTLMLGLVAGVWAVSGAAPLFAQSRLAIGLAVLILASCYATAVALLASHALAALLRKYQD